MQLVKSSSPETPQHFSICPLRLAVASRVSNRSKTDFAAKVLDILHEGVARELRAIVGDDPVWHTKTTHYSLEELDR